VLPLLDGVLPLLTVRHIQLHLGMLQDDRG
jgi:hypothetical protein